MRRAWAVVLVLVGVDLLLAFAPVVSLRNWLMHPRGMVRVPAGVVTTAPKGRTLYVPEFYIDVHEVTNADFARFVAARQSRPLGPWDAAAPPQLAAAHVKPADAEAYARYRGCRLPSSAEWDAAFGPATYPWGETWQPGAANVADATLQAPGSHPLDRSPWGVLDLAGGLSEWTADTSGPTSQRPLYLVRGGSWMFVPRGARRQTIAAYGGASPGIGFRCVWP